MSVLDNFNEWKGFLSSRLNQAEADGIDQQTISNLAYEVGDYLAKQVDPKNDEERILAELWKVASPDEQHALANTMVKLVQNQGS
jgi:hypothetical protein